MSICKVDGCGHKSRTLGLCNKHALRFKRYGHTGHTPRSVAPLAERFSRNVSKRDDGCWLWLGNKRPNGYGQIQEGGKGSRTRSAHRVAYELANGPIPPGRVVMHSCDNRACVNPAHLSVGAPIDNTKDMIAKGRKRTVAPLGIENGKAVLTDELVRYIRTQTTKSLGELASELGVGKTTIRNVRNKRCWAHVK